MKTQIASFIIIPAMLLTAASAPAYEKNESQQAVVAEQSVTTSFSFFRTHRQGRGITSSWGMSTNNGVVNFTLQRTYEDPTDPYALWEEVNTVACNGGRSYKCTDGNVFPGSVTYRVSAMLNNGSTIVSELSTVRVNSR